MSTYTMIERVRQALEEVSGHFYTEQDSARCRALAKEALPILDILSREIDNLRTQIAFRNEAIAFESKSK